MCLKQYHDRDFYEQSSQAEYTGYDEATLRDLIIRGHHLRYDHQDRTPIHWAAIRDDTDMLKRLAETGININEYDKGGQTPLHLAVARGNVSAVEELLKQGADPMIERQGLLPPLTMACEAEYNRKEIFEAFSKSGYPVDQSNHGYTALHHAARTANAGAVGDLIELGANVDIQDINGWTPLHYISIEDVDEDMDVIRSADKLVAAGADLTLRDYQGKSAVQKDGSGFLEGRYQSEIAKREHNAITEAIGPVQTQVKRRTLKM